MADFSVPPAVSAGGNADHASVELSSRRTGMSFQRTRMSADRTLMSVIRTALSLISFGFTIYQFFAHLREQDVLSESASTRNFGSMLVYVGVIMLLTGIVYHVLFMRGLRRERADLCQAGADSCGEPDSRRRSRSSRRCSCSRWDSRRSRASGSSSGRSADASSPDGSRRLKAWRWDAPARVAPATFAQLARPAGTGSPTY